MTINWKTIESCLSGGKWRCAIQNGRCQIWLPAAERKRCSSSECIKLGVASVCENKWLTKEAINTKLQSGCGRDDFPSALPPASPHYATRLQLRLVFYCLCVPRTSETEYLFLKTGSITYSNCRCWQRLWMFKTEAIPSLEHRLKSESANVLTTDPSDCLRFAFKVPYKKFSSLPGKSQQLKNAKSQHAKNR